MKCAEMEFVPVAGDVITGSSYKPAPVGGTYGWNAVNFNSLATPTNEIEKAPILYIYDWSKGAITKTWYTDSSDNPGASFKTDPFFAGPSQIADLDATRLNITEKAHSEINGVLNYELRDLLDYNLMEKASPIIQKAAFKDIYFDARENSDRHTEYNGNYVLILDEKTGKGLWLEYMEKSDSTM